MDWHGYGGICNRRQVQDGLEISKEMKMQSHLEGEMKGICQGRKGGEIEHSSMYTYRDGNCCHFNPDQWLLLSYCSQC